jgi:fructokinase
MGGNLTIVGLGEALWDVLPGGKVLGGAPLNVACHVHRLLGERGDGIVASRVGADVLGDEVLQALATREMSTEFVQRDPQHATSTVNVELHEGQPSYVFAPDIAWDHLEFTPEWAELAARCDAVCFGTLAQRSRPSREAIWQFLDAARQAIRLFDVNLRQGYFDREAIVEGCRRATIVKLNEHELSVVAESLGLPAASVDEQLHALRATLGLTAVVYTRGQRGTLLITADAIVDAQAVSYPAAANADPVGAGDACTAGVLVGWLIGPPPEKTAALANHLGAYVASQPGATPELPVAITAMID